MRHTLIKSVLSAASLVAFPVLSGSAAAQSCPDPNKATIAIWTYGSALGIFYQQYPAKPGDLPAFYTWPNRTLNTKQLYVLERGGGRTAHESMLIVGKDAVDEQLKIVGGWKNPIYMGNIADSSCSFLNYGYVSNGLTALGVVRKPDACLNGQKVTSLDSDIVGTYVETPGSEQQAEAYCRKPHQLAKMKIGADGTYEWADANGGKSGHIRQCGTGRFSEYFLEGLGWADATGSISAVVLNPPTPNGNFPGIRIDPYAGIPLAHADITNLMSHSMIIERRSAINCALYGGSPLPNQTKPAQNLAKGCSEKADCSLLKASWHSRSSGDLGPDAGGAVATMHLVLFGDGTCTSTLSILTRLPGANPSSKDSTGTWTSDDGIKVNLVGCGGGSYVLSRSNDPLSSDLLVSTNGPILTRDTGFNPLSTGNVQAESVSSYLKKGDNAFHVGDYAAAAAAYSTALQINDKTVAAWHNRALANQQLGKMAEAMSDINHSLSLDPTFKKGSGRYARALMNRKLNNYQDYLQDLQVAANLGSSKAQQQLAIESKTIDEYHGHAIDSSSGDGSIPAANGKQNSQMHGIATIRDMTGSINTSYQGPTSTSIYGRPISPHDNPSATSGQSMTTNSTTRKVLSPYEDGGSIDRDSSRQAIPVNHVVPQTTTYTPQVRQRNSVTPVNGQQVTAAVGKTVIQYQGGSIDSDKTASQMEPPNSHSMQQTTGSASRNHQGNMLVGVTSHANEPVTAPAINNASATKGVLASRGQPISGNKTVKQGNSAKPAKTPEAHQANKVKPVDTQTVISYTGGTIQPYQAGTIQSNQAGIMQPDR